MLKFFIEISSIIVSFILIFYIVMRLPKEIIGLLNSRPQIIFSQKLINIKILLLIVYLISVLIFLNMGK